MLDIFSTQHYLDQQRKLMIKRFECHLIALQMDRDLKQIKAENMICRFKNIFLKIGLEKEMKKLADKTAQSTNSINSFIKMLNDNGSRF